MMNLKTIATTCLAVSGLALAQDGTVPASSFPTPASSSSSVAAPRTGLYTGVTKGNAAADNTVDQYSRRPTLIGDRQYFAGFGGADMQNAAYNFNLGGLNWFGAVTADSGTAPATIRFGAGSGTSWGAGLLLSIDRTYSQPTNNGTETTTYTAPSGIGIFGDFNLGSSDVYGQIGWNTGSFAGSTSTTTVPATGAETNVTNRTLSIMGGWKKDATVEGTHAINVEAQYDMEMHDDDRPVAPAADIDLSMSTISVMPSWGYIVKSNSDYGVFIGVNSLEQYITREQGSDYTVSLTPNIAFQKQLGKGFEGFSGFSVTALWDSNSDQPVDGASNSLMFTGFADVAVGLRWVKDNFAFEGSVNETLLKNGPQLVSGTGTPGGMFFEVGMALGF